jgi:uncharacterized membrane protein
MTKGLRLTLWILSSLAVLWAVLALVGLFTMGCCGMLGPGGMMGGMMLQMTLTWLVMLGLVGVFVYLILTGRRSR